MRETIRVKDHAELIMKAWPKGILLNTQGEKFNSMVVGWGFLGTIWGRECVTVFLRERRYSRMVIDQTGEFTLSIPLEGPIADIHAVCGTLSGHSVDKAARTGLTLVEPRSLSTPGILEYPMTLECKVLYSQKQEAAAMPEEIREAIYPALEDSEQALALSSPHVEYIAEILDAYILRK